MALKTGDMGVVEDGIRTEIDYVVKDPKHEHEKPYDVRYDTGGIIPNTNMSSESRPVIIHDFRPLQNSQSFQEYGFSLEKIDCALTATVFNDQKRIKEAYYPAIEQMLWQKFPDAAEVKILEHTVSIYWFIIFILIW